MTQLTIVWCHHFLSPDMAWDRLWVKYRNHLKYQGKYHQHTVTDINIINVIIIEGIRKTPNIQERNVISAVAYTILTQCKAVWVKVAFSSFSPPWWG